MSRSLYTIRNYRPADFNAFIQLTIEVETMEPMGRCTSPRILGESLKQPNFSPERDMFVAEINRNIVGFMSVTSEPYAGRVILDCLLHPEHRQQGLATKLLDYAMRRARELKAKVAHVNVMEDNKLAGDVLSRLDFKVVRLFLELRLRLDDFYHPTIISDTDSYHQLRHGEEDKLTRLQNRCFTGTWGYNPNTPEEIVQRLKLSQSSPDDVVLIYDSNKPVGYCWSIACQDEEDTVEKIWRIYMLGVDPDYRGKGIGRKVLLAGLSYLKNKGIQIAELTVDSENKAACSLYYSAGFNIWTRSLWYEKSID